jgi:hypothetical protein
MSEKFGGDKEMGERGEGMNKRKDTITLPSREEMLERLNQFDDSPDMQQQFYPLLLQHAGSSLMPQGVVTVFEASFGGPYRGNVIASRKGDFDEHRWHH